MKKKFILFLLFLGFVASPAVMAQVPGMFVAESGQTTAYAIDDVQVMTFTTTDLNVNASSVDAYAMDDVVTITFDMLTGVSEVGNASAIGVYPNPTSGIVNLEVHGNASSVTVSIYNVAGSLLSTVSYDKTGDMLKTTIDMTDYVPGVYILQIGSANDVITKKILKQ